MDQPAKIGDYRVLEPIDTGSYGETFLVETPTGRKVVLKRLKLEQVMDDKATELFDREAAVLASMDHTSVPQFIDSGVGEDGLPYLVQEYIPGDTLEKAVASGHRFDSQAALAMTRRLLHALHYLHNLAPPVLHRDLKPANIILSPDGPVIVDFGAVAGRALLAGEPSGTVVGTFGYMAPELLKGQASPASDLYSLGATLLFAFTGREPDSFPQERLEIQFRKHVKLADRLINLLEGLLKPAVEDRPQSAQDALDLLDSKGRSGALVKRVKKPMSRRKRTVLKVAGGAALIGTVVAYLVMGHVAFLALAKSVAIGVMVLLIFFLLLITFVGF